MSKTFDDALSAAFLAGVEFAQSKDHSHKYPHEIVAAFRVFQRDFAAGVRTTFSVAHQPETVGRRVEAVPRAESEAPSESIRWGRNPFA